METKAKYLAIYKLTKRLKEFTDLIEVTNLSLNAKEKRLVNDVNGLTYYEIAVLQVEIKSLKKELYKYQKKQKAIESDITFYQNLLQ